MLSKLDMEKETKMEALRQANSQLKELINLERIKKQQITDLKMAARAVDSIEFGGARKSKNSEMMDRAKQAKESRDKIREQYNEYLEYEEFYKEIDPIEYPAVLFFHDSVIKNYGLCPYLKVTRDTNTHGTNNNGTLKEQLREDRHLWLQRQKDGGQLYSDLYARFVNLTEKTEIVERLAECENALTNFVSENYTSSQFKVYTEAVTLLKEYTTCQIKTKRLKEKFKVILTHLSILFSETSFPIQDFLSKKYKVELIVNDLQKTTNTTTPTNKTDQFMKGIIIERCMALVKEYNHLHEQLEKVEKYTNNVLKNMKNEMYLYFVGQKTYTPETPKTVCHQVGKYFKKWTLLLPEERSERFLSYADYYIERYMIRENILSPDLKSEYVDKLYNLLNSSYEQKQLVYKDFKWNISKGFIENIGVLRFNKEKATFMLTGSAGKKTTVSSVKRKTSTKTIITKITEQVINEEILQYTIGRVGGSERSEQELTEMIIGDCIEIVKNKLKVKKLLSSDKQIVENKIREIWSVVVTNRDQL